jgi:type II secretory pathway component PulL
MEDDWTEAQIQLPAEGVHVRSLPIDRGQALLLRCFMKSMINDQHCNAISDLLLEEQKT